MKMNEALEIIKGTPKGFMVSFEKVGEGILASGHFPDLHAGERLISTEQKAWEFAVKFAEATYGEYINIYVIDNTFSPVNGYAKKKIINK